MYDTDTDTMSECIVTDDACLGDRQSHFAGHRRDKEKRHAEDAVKAAHISLTADKAAQPEATADARHINAIRFWKKEMK